MEPTNIIHIKAGAIVPQANKIQVNSISADYMRIVNLREIIVRIPSEDLYYFRQVLSRIVEDVNLTPYIAMGYTQRQILRTKIAIFNIQAMVEKRILALGMKPTKKTTLKFQYTDALEMINLFTNFDIRISTAEATATNPIIMQLDRII